MARFVAYLEEMKQQMRLGLVADRSLQTKLVRLSGTLTPLIYNLSDHLRFLWNLFLSDRIQSIAQLGLVIPRNHSSVWTINITLIPQRRKWISHCDILL